MTPLALVYTSGGKFDRRYVGALLAQVMYWRNPAFLVLVTDTPELGDDIEGQFGLQTVVVAAKYPSFWAKLQLWSLPYERLVYIDLDSYVVSDPAPLFEHGPACCPDLLYEHSTAVMVIEYDSSASRQMQVLTPRRGEFGSDQPMLDLVKPSYPYFPGRWCRSIKELSREFCCTWPDRPPGIGSPGRWNPKNPHYDDTGRPIVVNFHGQTRPDNTLTLPQDAPPWLRDAHRRWWMAYDRKARQ